MRFLAVIPSFYGRAGSAINERQLIMCLASKVKKCYVVTFVGLKQIFTKERRDLKLSMPRNMMVFPIPIPQINTLVIHLAMITVSCIISIIALFIDRIRKIDLIYIRYSFLSIGFLTFRSLSQKTIVKIPAIIEDEIECDPFVRKLAPLMDRRVLSKSRRVAVNSKTFYNMLIERRLYKRKDEPLIMPPSLDFNLIEKVKRKVQRNPRATTVNVGFIGSLSWWQGVEILVQAVSRLSKKISNLRLIIIGDGEQRTLIDKLGKLYGISYEITGLLSHEAALERLAMLDVMVLPRKKTPTTESIIPIKVIEAWALGIPVVATKHRVFLDYQLKNNQEIIYCEPNPVSVANAIFRLLTNYDLKKKLETNGPKLAKMFDYNTVAENLLKG